VFLGKDFLLLKAAVGPGGTGIAAQQKADEARGHQDNDEGIR